MSKRQNRVRKLERQLALVKGTAAGQPVQRSVAIAPAQADLYLKLQSAIESAQSQLNAAAGGILAGHGVTNAQGISLDKDPRKPGGWVIKFVDLTGVELPAPGIATPDAPAAPPPPRKDA